MSDNIGFVIAKPKIDAEKALITETYANTDAPILKVMERGGGTVSFGVSETSTTKEVKIPYALDYRPLIQAFCERKPGGNMQLMQSTNQMLSVDVIAGISIVDVDDVLLRFISTATVPTGTYRYLYYIFFDESEDD